MFVDVGLIFSLMVVFKLKHFVADYLLQGTYMLGKFKPGLDFILPLSAHCGVQALFTFIIASLVQPHLALFCGVLDFTIHFTMDRIKASPNMMGRWKNFSGNEYGFIARGFEPVTAGEIGVSGIHVKSLTEARKKKLFRDNKLFWWALGFDQMIHGLTDILIMYILLR